VLEDCRLSLLTERRRRAPRGAAGGGDGALGENRLNGRLIGGKLSRELHAGDLLEIRTPGGGGYGPPSA
jgi:N-methylhydantoinase B